MAGRRIVALLLAASAVGSTNGKGAIELPSVDIC